MDLDSVLRKTLQLEAMSKGFLIVTFICLCTFFTNVEIGRAEPKSLSKDELQSFLKPYLKLKTLSSDFVQKKHLEDLHLDLTSTGHLDVKKPKNVVWTILKPAFIEVRIAEKDLTLTSIKEGQKQEQKISFSQMGSEQGAQGLALLVPWLEMNVDQLMADYTILETAPLNLQFTPTKPSLFKKINLKLAKNNHIKNLTFTEQNGDSIDIEFKATHIENTL